MPSIQVILRPPHVDALWGAARWCAFVATGLLLAWLVASPSDALTALWYVVVPLLPASFFLSPLLWRGVCPLATFNELGNRVGTPRPLSPRAAAVLGTGGLVLFYLMVPARRFLFNADGPVLAITIVAVAAIAVGLGALFVVRSGFCNALCPVLPVELAYGQAPLIRLQRGRCSTCTLCTPRGCIDLAPGKALAQVLGSSRRTDTWLRTPNGAFLAALPGFIVGYFLLTDGGLDSAARVYATTLGAALASYAIVAVIVLAFSISARAVHLALAALAGGLYYWYSGPTIAKELGLQAAVGTGIRVVGIALVLYWIVSGLRVRR